MKSVDYQSGGRISESDRTVGKGPKRVIGKRKKKTTGIIIWGVWGLFD